jgi:hypothetical protein
VVCALVLLGSAAACSQPDQPGGPTTSTAPTSLMPSTSSPAPTTSTSSPPTTSPTPAPTTTVTPTTTAKPTPTYRTILKPGDRGPKVRELQARLRQIGWFDGNVTDYYGTRTTAAVKGFQAKRGFPVTGIVDERTWNRLLSMTHKPTRDELDNVSPAPTRLIWDVDKRCLTGRVMCISKETRELTWVINGVPQYEMDVRFGSEEYPTREGTFYVYKKMEYVYSELYDSPMPYSMFFSGGQAVHYSSNFARIGYAGASHGCVNVRDWDAVKRLYYDSRIGDKVVIHW